VVLADKFWKMFGSQKKNSPLFPVLKLCGGRVLSKISVLHCGVIEVLVLLGRYMAWVGSWLPTVQDSLSFPSSRVKYSKENRTSRLSYNIGNKLPAYAT
jgi:hypothetical protein